MPRPEVDSVSGFTGWLFKILRGADRPNNVFPSLHVSAVVLISIINAHHFPKSKWLGVLAVLAVSASTLFVKQHAVVDILGGIIFGFGAYYIFFKKSNQKEQPNEQAL
jgi:membrane-associated phospholipid phosphatase